MTKQSYTKDLKLYELLAIPRHNAVALAKIAGVEHDFGKDFYSVLDDFAKLHSFRFTMLTLELNKDTFSYCKPLFKARLMARQERTHMIGNRYAATYPPIPEGCPVSRSGVYYRLSIGWSWEDAVGKPKGRGGKVANFKGKRNSSTWRDSITRDSKIWQDRKAVN
jgi:hypothetical protein